MKNVKNLINLIQKKNFSLISSLNRNPKKIKEKVFNPPAKLYMYDEKPEMNFQK